MYDIPLGVWLGALAFLVLLSAFFSAAEIGLMTLNRYRLRHLADSGHRGARMAAKLLERPDRLLGVILLGNNFANIAASAVVTVITLDLFGEADIWIATLVLTFVVLIFAEVAPKTLAAAYPERTAFPAVYVLRPLLTLFYPLVALVNAIANRLLRMLGVKMRHTKDQLSSEELKAAVVEAGSLIPLSHQSMLLAILDLEKVTVDDVMVPRGEIEGIDIEAEWPQILQQIANSHYTRLPVYRDTLDNIIGMVHLRNILPLIHNDKLNRDSLVAAMAEPYFIPQGTPLNTQLLNFKTTKRRIGLVVDEYGDLLGLVTLEEILEEIVGDFTTQSASSSEDVRAQQDGSYLVNAAVTLRDLNRRLTWNLPTDGPKTVNGLIVEYLEDIPTPGTSLSIGDYEFEIVRTRGPRVQLVRIRARAPVPSTE